MANEDKRIIELPASESILNDDWIGKDSASEGTTKMQLSFLKQLFGGNNFAGEWQSGTVYNKDAYVTHEGKLYHNIKGGSVVAVNWTSSQWQEIDVSSELKKVVGSLAPTFDSSTNYDVDDLVTFNGALCRCISPHSAGAWNSSHFASVRISSLLTYFIMDNFTDKQWEKYSGSPVNYTKGTVIHKGLNMYRCKANTTNQSWDSSKWEQVDVTDLINSVTVLAETVLSNIAPTFSSLAQYNINDFVIYNNQLYICVKPHHGSWDSTDFSAGIIGYILEAIFNNIADVYSPSGSYVKGDVVNYLGMPLRCIVDTATSPMVFSEWEQVTVEQLINEKVADVQIAGQTTTDENKISDLTSLAIEGTASGEIASFSDGSNLPMRSFVCNIDAVQDLHGYDAPWVGGAGKNKLMQLNSSKTTNGITFTKNSDGTVTANGTATNNAFFLFNARNNDVSDLLPIVPTGTNCIISGCPSGGSNDTYRIMVAEMPSGSSYANDIGNGASFTYLENTSISIRIASGTTVNNLVFKPMIRLSTETDPTFAPYSNICPISGHTGIDAVVRGKNLVNWKWNAFNDGKMEIFLKGGTYTLSAESTLSDGKGYIRGTKPSGEYVSREELGLISWSATTTSGLYYGGSVQQQTYTFNVPNGGAKIEFGKINNNGTISAQLESGSTASTYTPYNPQSQNISVSWQTEAGEVFDGYIDLVSGLLTVTHKSQTGFTRGRQDSTHKLYNIGFPAGMKRHPDGPISPYFIDSMFEKMSLANARAAEIPSITQYDNALYVGGYIGKEAELDTLLETLQVKYELETPITYQLTPQQIKSLLGENNAWCDTGDVDVKYNKDATIAYENTGGGGSELIQFGAGDGTTSRTFQLSRTPRKITMAYFEGSDDNGWASQYTLIWGVARAFGIATGAPANTAGEAKTVGITYGADNKSFTVNASNAGSAMNTTSGHGYLMIEY